MRSHAVPYVRSHKQRKGGVRNEGYPQKALWTAICGIIVGIAAAFGLDENEWAQIAGIVTSAISVVAYIFGEAAIDAGNRTKKDDKQE